MFWKASKCCGEIDERIINNDVINNIAPVMMRLKIWKKIL